MLSLNKSNDLKKKKENSFWSDPREWHSADKYFNIVISNYYVLFLYISSICKEFLLDDSHSSVSMNLFLKYVIAILISTVHQSSIIVSV